MNFWAIVRQLSEGFFGNSLLLFALTLIMSLPLGLVISFGSMSKFKPLRWLTRTFVWIIRGTPLMLQVTIIFFAPGLLFDTPWTGGYSSRMTAAVIAFVINYSAYFSEIYRGGIESIAVGQFEAGAVLGMTRTQVFFKVVLLQVVKRIIPPMSNEIITLVKDTSLARIISVAEIFMVAERFTAKGLIWPLFFTGIYYLIFNGMLTILFSFTEKKLNYFRG